MRCGWWNVMWNSWYQISSRWAVNADEKNFWVLHELCVKGIAIARMSVATSSGDRELMVVAIEVNIFPVLRVWWKYKTPNPDIMKLQKWRDFGKCWSLNIFVFIYSHKKSPFNSLLIFLQLWLYESSMFSSYISCRIFSLVIDNHFFRIPLPKNPNLKQARKLPVKQLGQGQ